VCCPAALCEADWPIPGPALQTIRVTEPGRCASLSVQNCVQMFARLPSLRLVSGPDNGMLSFACVHAAR